VYIGMRVDDGRKIAQKIEETSRKHDEMKEKNKRKCVNGSESLRLNLRNGRGGVSVSVKKKGKITTWMQGEVVGAQHSKRLLRRAMRPDPQNLISADPEPKPARGGGSNHWNKETGRNKNNTTSNENRRGLLQFQRNV